MIRILIMMLSLLLIFSSVSAAAPPNIIIMVADDLGWKDVGYHGGLIETPNIDRLAAEGVQLNQFYVQPVCSPTRGALLTGRYPSHLGLQCGVVRPWASHGLPLDEQTLPQMLKTAGYQTAICGKWHLGHVAEDYLPTRRGFDLQYGHYNGALDYFTHIRDGGHDWHRNDESNFDKGYTTDLIGQAASEIIKNHKQQKPLFLYVPFNAPHTPLQAKPKDIEKYQHFKNRDRQIYAAMVDSMDQAIGQILNSLESANFENTLIFFSSDNGGIPKFGSNGELRAGKGTLYEGGVRVPAFIHWKEKLKPGLIDEPLHIVDLYPTLLNIAGVEMNQRQKPLDGRDAWLTISEGKPSPHKSILFNVTPFHGAVRVRNWKLIHNGAVTANNTNQPKEETWELFDLINDPSEKNDLSMEVPEKLRELKQVLKQFEDSAVTPNIPPNKAPKDFRVPEVWGEFEKS